MLITRAMLGTRLSRPIYLAAITLRNRTEVACPYPPAATIGAGSPFMKTYKVSEVRTVDVVGRTERLDMVAFLLYDVEKHGNFELIATKDMAARLEAGGLIIGATKTLINMTEVT